MSDGDAPVFDRSTTMRRIWNDEGGSGEMDRGNDRPLNTERLLKRHAERQKRRELTSKEK